MASILKVDTIQDQSGNNIINESSDTITIGASGDTINIPSGATITNSGTATGFGKVLQVLSATDSTQRTTSSSSFVTASNTLSVAITPSSASNKVLIICDCTYGQTGAGEQGLGTIFRDSTNLGTSVGMMNSISDTGTIKTPGSMSFLDSPNSTSAITYQAYFRTAGGGSLEINKNGVQGSITAFEIEG
jgi:hypothetical protein